MIDYKLIDEIVDAVSNYGQVPRDL